MGMYMPMQICYVLPMHKKLNKFLLLLLVTLPSHVMAAVSVDIALNKEVEVSVRLFPANGTDLFLWLPSESGILEQETRIAEKLAQQGVEVRMPDLHAAYFLPVLASSTEMIPAKDVAELIERIREQSKKRVYLVSSGRGALLVLRAAREWQMRYGDKARLGGAIIISPKLFIETPEPGQEGELMPVVSVSNLPLFIIQPEKSPWRWKLDQMLPALREGGSDVFIWILPHVRDRFYYRSNAVKYEDDIARRLPDYLVAARKLLDTVNQKPRPIVTKNIATPPVPMEGKKDRLLREFSGDPTPPALRLANLQGKVQDLKQFKGQVVLVNFWASWCPPCVHEMPSMQRLADHYKGKPFTILAVNMAEERAEIDAFLKKKVKVDFPILLDLDGSALKRWKVFAFPTSYVVDKSGRIRLALFGAIDWDQPDVMQKLDTLIEE
jgi:thiol-disulfide isomerase/thioredoxin